MIASCGRPEKTDILQGEGGSTTPFSLGTASGRLWGQADNRSRQNLIVSGVPALLLTESDGPLINPSAPAYRVPRENIYCERQSRVSCSCPIRLFKQTTITLTITAAPWVAYSCVFGVILFFGCALAKGET